ncbi:uncharacterized protein LOC106013790, partial [Aplysia californica]|uniref:Uncharacterized protein LOC106013790 n=1 Tax=Aplysia californica TaxID=6500 RepID=A0ABM1AE10_APLCA
TYRPKILADVTAFKGGILSAITKATGISKLRVSSIKINFENVIRVRAVLLDKAPISGDVKSVKQQVDLKTAGDALMDAIRRGQFTVSLKEAGNAVSSYGVPVIASSVREQEYIVKAPEKGYGTGV